MIKPIIKTAISANSFVGIKIEDGIPTITFPNGIDSNELQKSDKLNMYILSLAKSISYTKTYYKNKIEIKDSFKNSSGFPLFDFLWILKDFLDFGIYHAKEITFQKNTNGKINWKRTIQEDFTISNNSIIFNAHIYNKGLRVDDQITKIHSYCIYEANKLCGWFFGNIQVPNINKLPYSIKNSINILKSKLVNVFDDRTKMLLKIMINILDSEYAINSLNRIFEFGTNNYEIVWELMIDRIFGNTDISKFYPSAQYEFIDGSKIIAKSKLRPDTLLLKEENAYLLDSKYYQYGNTGDGHDLPSVSDIQKQVAYGEHVNYRLIKREGFQLVYNAFVLPYCKTNPIFIQKGLGKNIDYAGYAFADWHDMELDISYKKVLLIMVDTKYVLENVSRVVYDTAIDNLINLIHNIE